MYSSTMGRSNSEKTDASAEQLLLERLGSAIRAAGLTCWEWSYAQKGFSWFDGLPADESLHAAEIAKRQQAIISSLVPEDATRMGELIAPLTCCAVFFEDAVHGSEADTLQRNGPR